MLAAGSQRRANDHQSRHPDAVARPFLAPPSSSLKVLFAAHELNSTGVLNARTLFNRGVHSARTDWAPTVPVSPRPIEVVNQWTRRVGLTESTCYRSVQFRVHMLWTSLYPSIVPDHSGWTEARWSKSTAGRVSWPIVAITRPSEQFGYAISRMRKTRAKSVP